MTTNPILVAEKTDGGLYFLWRHPVGQTTVPAVLTGRLRNPIEQLDPRTGKPRVVENDDGTSTPAPIMLSEVKAELPGLREIELAGDIVELLVDGVSVWAENA